MHTITLVSQLTMNTFYWNLMVHIHKAPPILTPAFSIVNWETVSADDEEELNTLLELLLTEAGERSRKSLHCINWLFSSNIGEAKNTL